ncbi:MAG: hypothetical protein J6U20_00420 [Fibrobacter sp.]|nr:hypothetical protein [Fibrobacter sp.]
MKHLLRTSLSLVLALAAASQVYAIERKAALGGFDGFVERMGAGTREMGRGNTGSADTASMPGAYWNPGILGFRQNTNYTLNADKRDLDRMGGNAGIETKVGNRMGVGFAMLYRGDLAFDVVNEDDETVGTATPYFTMMYLGFAYRATRQDAIGLSLSMSYDNLDISEHIEGYEVVDDYRSPVTINLGWLRQWNDKWSTSVVIRNLSFSENLSAKWDRNTSTDNSLPSTEGVRPKVLQIGLGYRSHIMGKPVYAWMEAIDYQVADTLLAFDPQLHVWTGRVGFECDIIEGGTVRVGMDDLDFTFGLGYKFNVRIGKKKYLFDANYALLYESEAGLWNPLSFGLRGFIP